MTTAIIQTDGRAIVLDLSHGARLCGQNIAGLDVTTLGELIDRTMAKAGTAFAFGRYAEPRELYSNENFASDETEESRTIHMGIDLFCREGTPVRSPLDGTVAFLANNDAELDYGPLIILRHEDESGAEFLHLVRSSVSGHARAASRKVRSFAPASKSPVSVGHRPMATGRHISTFNSSTICSTWASIFPA